ncbi:HNH endonuclease signature motif containing protein [Nocardioides sp.]|uniref:HNH endonuclease signature motif containing protein n=1 Tax=Nocardioides sp. TaxID=35761 RepID=UPI00262737D4|nr:HNH endonuclease signature motif containing protein [Nocardioides sp.]
MSRHLDGTGTGHPVLVCLDALEAELDAIKDAPAWSLSAEETEAAIARLSADLARLSEVETRLLGQAESLDLPGQLGASSLSAWLARTTRMTKGEAGRHTKLAKSLSAHEPTREAVARGDVLAEQATAITAAVDNLDDDLASEREVAEKHLIEQAAHFDAYELRRLGEKLFEVLDPETAEAREAKRLADLEAEARKKAEITFRNGGDGTIRGNFVLPELQAEMFRKALQALASPKHVRATEGAGAYDYEKPTPHKLGLAFMEYIERYRTDGLPKQGGLAATVVITAEAETFTQGAEKAGHTETGTGVSPGQLLRLACEAKVFPAVMDTGGHVLDLGRGTRFHTPAQRLALLVEQKHCQHPSCDIPGAFCHVHHTTPWSDGGHTNTLDAVLLCPFHHHQAHATGQTYPMRT